MDNKEYGVKLTVDISDLKDNLEEAKQATEEAKNRIQTSLNNIYIKTEDIINPDFFSGLRDGLEETFGEDIPDDLIDSLKDKIEEIRPLSEQYAELIKKYKELTSKSTGDLIFESDKKELAEVKQQLVDVVKEIEKITGEKISIKGITDTNKKLFNLKKGFEGLEGTFKKVFKKGISDIKRFSLSLIGIRGAFSIITKSANAYMSLDNKMSTRLKANWIALGAIFSPIIEKIVSLFQKAVAYINIFVKTLTGGKVDLLSKAMKAVEKSTGKTTKQVKKLNNELSSLDEIENLDFDHGGADEDENFDIKSALEEIQNIELNPKIVEIVEKVATYIKDKIIPTVKDLYNWFKDLNIPWKLIGATILAIKLGPMGALILAVGALVAKILEAKKAWENFKESQNQVKNTQVKGLQLISQKIEENNDKIANGNLSDEEKAKLQSQNNTLLNEAQRYYEQINREQKNGVQYTQAEITEIENLKAKIEDLSGTKIDIEINWLSNTKNLNMFSKLIEQILGGGLGATGNFLSSLRKGLFGFARGNVAYEPTIAQFGEYAGARSNPEITTPQNVMRETLYDALSDALPMMGGQTGDIILNVNGRELARATYDDFKQEQNRLGTSNVAVRRV